MTKSISAGIICAVTVLVFFMNLSLCKASAITIDFEGLAVGDALLDQYQSQGIYFRDQLSYSGNSPGKIVETGSKSLQPHTNPQAMFILLANPSHFFSFDKWEPSSEQGGDGGENVQQPTEKPAEEQAPGEPPPQGDYTVYWHFFSYDGTNYQDAGVYYNSDKNLWVRVPFTFSEPISAVHIWGDIVNNQPYYLDNLRFDTSINPVPEPATMPMLALAIVGLAGFRRKNNLKAGRNI
jgi:hypothetical protein